jgi:hypothetical protein
MRKMIMLLGVTGALAAPVAARADTPTQAGTQKAEQACRFERGATAATREAFRTKYGTNKNGKNAFGKCVSAKAKALEDQAEAQDRQDASARKSAAKTCAAARGTTADSRAAFKAKYGKHGHDAFGRCVSQTAKAGDDS